jgi:N-acylneuraminate cytidylyltransferase
MSSNLKDVLCIIPARGSSKCIPLKNIQPIAGKPLLAYTVEHARKTPVITRVIVSTDSPEIAATAHQHGAEVVWRPATISDDTATSESALIHVLDHLRDSEDYEPDLVVFLQATSPMRKSDDIQKAIDTLQCEKADSLFSACPLHGFVWRREGGQLSSLSYDYRNRERRQDAPEDLLENGSIYIFKLWVLRQFNNRLGGKIAVYVMDPLDSFQVDEAHDLKNIESLMAVRLTKLEKESPNLSNVHLLVLDFDGVLTDNRVLVNQTGNEAVWCHRGDGWGIDRLKDAGVEVIVLSTEKNPVVAARCRKLGIECVQGCNDKFSALKKIVQERSLSKDQVAYVGNDFNDLDCMRWVGIPIAVADAVNEVKQVSHLVTNREGGRGAVRDLCDLILFAFKKGENHG